MSLGFAEMRERKKGGGKEHIVKTVSEEMLRLALLVWWLLRCDQMPIKTPD